MSPAVYYNFQQIINAYFNKNFDQQRFSIVALDGTPWMHLSIHEALHETFHIIEKESNLYLYFNEYCDILKGKKVKNLSQRKSILDEWARGDY